MQHTIQHMSAPLPVAESQAKVTVATKEAGEAKAEIQTASKELQETASELSSAQEACRRMKAKLAERKQAATAMAAALASELGLPNELQSALEAQDIAQLPSTLTKLGQLVCSRPCAVGACAVLWQHTAAQTAVACWQL